MEDFTEIKDIPGRHVMIMGSGASIKQFKDKIIDYINKENIIVVGINKVTHIYVPHYHMWGNAGRWHLFSKCIDPRSKLILGPKIWKKANYTNHLPNKDIYTYRLRKKGNVFNYKSGCFYGFFHCVGNIAIYLVSILGASEISVVGTDGYTLHSRNELDDAQGDHHCYGKGYTDKSDWQTCIRKDKDTYNILRQYRDGKKIEFKILTPTVYKEFYKPEILGVE